MNEKIHAHLKHVGGYKFDISFDELKNMKVTMDEPAPVGASEGPSAAMMLSSAVGHCLSSSLLFCLEKARAKVRGLSTDVETDLARNDKGRWRVGGIKVKLMPDVHSLDREKLERCLGMFEDFCIVTASVKQGIKVEVEVEKN
ncbi:MAG: OsmC family protein [Thermoplasmata archaeon]